MCLGPCTPGFVPHATYTHPPHTQCRYWCSTGSQTPTQNLCPQGNFCPSGSPSPTPCPTGYYGSTQQLVSSACSGPCPPGLRWCLLYFTLFRYILSKERNDFAADVPWGLHLPECSYRPACSMYPHRNNRILFVGGPGNATWYCPPGSTQQQPCPPSAYCPTDKLPNSLPCPVGFYCPRQRLRAPVPCIKSLALLLKIRCQVLWDTFARSLKWAHRCCATRERFVLAKI